jgi:nicotinate-nucleotide adenylyltransferase
VTQAIAQRIGLLGGSFDPIHRAHLELAHCARRELGLDAVWLIPVGQPWQRGALQADPAQRWDMLQLALQGQPGLRACDLELRRDGPSYTIDTLRELLAAHPATQFTLIVGADQLANLQSWRDWQQIVALADLAAARRPGHAELPAPALLEALARGGHRLHRLPMAEQDVSATAVRERARRGLHLQDALLPAVARYIEQHRLYSTNDPHGHP